MCSQARTVQLSVTRKIREKKDVETQKETIHPAATKYLGPSQNSGWDKIPCTLFIRPSAIKERTDDTAAIPALFS